MSVQHHHSKSAFLHPPWHPATLSPTAALASSTRLSAVQQRSKTKSKLAGPDDGLEDLVGGITAGTGQLLPAYLQSAADRAVVAKIMGGADRQDDGRKDRRATNHGKQGGEDEPGSSGGDSESDMYEDEDGDDGGDSDDEDGESDEDEDDGLMGLLEDSMSGSAEDEGDEGEDGSEDDGEDGEDEEGEDDMLGGRMSRDSGGSGSEDASGSDSEDDVPEGESARQRSGAAAGPGPKSSGAAGAGGARYVPPALRAKLAAGGEGSEASKAHLQTERRIVGLLNRWVCRGQACEWVTLCPDAWQLIVRRSEIKATLLGWAPSPKLPTAIDGARGTAVRLYEAVRSTTPHACWTKCSLDPHRS